jgi:hypothetical protein
VDASRGSASTLWSMIDPDGDDPAAPIPPRRACKKALALTRQRAGRGTHRTTLGGSAPPRRRYGGVTP